MCKALLTSGHVFYRVSSLVSTDNKGHAKGLVPNVVTCMHLSMLIPFIMVSCPVNIAWFYMRIKVSLVHII